MLIKFLKNFLHRLGFSLVRWPSSTERLEPQALMCAKLFNVEGLIDVGAHKGEFCLALAPFLSLKSIHLFEPDVANPLPTRSSFPSVKQYCVYRKAVYSSRGTRLLNLYSSPDFNSLLLPTPFGLRNFPSSLRLLGKEKVAVDTLDDLMASSLDTSIRYLLKIDAQGVDLDVLRGAERVLLNVDVICLELSFIPVYEGQPDFTEAFSLLSCLGFALSSISPVTRFADRSLIEANAVFVRNVSV